jgi:hypothetical protein
MHRTTMMGMYTITGFYMLCGCLGYASFGYAVSGNTLIGFGFYEPFWLVGFANTCIIMHLVGGFKVFLQAAIAVHGRRGHCGSAVPRVNPLEHATGLRPIAVGTVPAPARAGTAGQPATLPYRASRPPAGHALRLGPRARATRGPRPGHSRRRGPRPRAPGVLGPPGLGRSAHPARGLCAHAAGGNLARRDGRGGRAAPVGEAVARAASP